MPTATPTAELLLYAGLTALVIGTVWRVALVVRDQGMSRFIRCGLVIIVYLIATSPLAVRSIFVQAISNDKAQGTATYIYSPGWILLSSTSFMANILITNCITIWRCWFLSGRRWMFSIIPGLCFLIGTIFAGFGLYQMIATSASGNTFILYRTVMGPRIMRRTRRLWIRVIVESSVLFIVGPIIFLAVYVMSDMSTGCPMLVVTMIMGLAPILVIAQVPSESASGQHREDSAV
ncbi:hypothetical protein ARMGADRAFT_1081159 [Armillaria gallica]|uniref:Uncharacterized protein n=1 Tax=Armillaria gallica TaxID=47427 RepID=A0A2H3DE22_ARMGA|nr:hypothetical protein ARMGADRAFT_1081159 [Armillaria gallica]